MKKIIFFIFLISKSTFAVDVAWWVNIEFKPTDTIIEGMPVAEIDNSWKYATLLKRSIIPKMALDSDRFDPMTEYNYKFTIEKDINKNGVLEKIVTGVFEDKNGNKGRFFLILEKSKGKWIKLYLYKSGKKPGFNILKETDAGEIFWTYCMECGMAGYIKWDGKKYYVKWKNT